MTFLLDLQCSECSTTYSSDKLQAFCQECSAPLLPRYDLNAAKQRLFRDSFAARPRGMWRWRELLPVHQPDNQLDLGQGDTPLLAVRNLGKELELSHLFVKDESINPTGSFKDRGLAAAVSKAKELGVEKLIIPTAGNAGGSLAAFAARAGLTAQVIMPEDSPQANVQECRAFGAQVTFVPGLISDAGKLSRDISAREGWFDVSTFKEPYRVEGKKIMGYELAESFDWNLPEVIIYPTGGGTGLIGMWKAFQELESLGWLGATDFPRMVAVQSEGCAPVVHAFQAGAEKCDFWTDAQTIASGLRVPKSFADRLILRTLRESLGTAVAVSDEQIREAQTRLGAREGIFAAPEGAATLAGLLELLDQGWVKGDERVVLFNTGSGLKYL